MIACPILGCGNSVPNGHIVCLTHWLEIPANDRKLLYLCLAEDNREEYEKERKRVISELNRKLAM